MVRDIKDVTEIAFDITLMKPGCAIGQATYGIPGIIATDFPTHTWLLGRTPDMKVYPLTPDILKMLRAKVIEAHGDGP